MAVNAKLLPIDPFGFFGFGGGAWSVSPLFAPTRYWGSKPKPAPVATIPVAAPITTSKDLPGSTHWDPATVPVGKGKGGSSAPPPVVDATPVQLPPLGVLLPWLPDFENEGQPPIIFEPPPIILPGQTDPRREEHETEEGTEDMAHTWLHLGSQVIGGLFPGQNPMAYTGNGSVPGFSGPVSMPTGDVAPMPMPTGVPSVYSGGTCAPPKTRTLTIDCATGLEVKRKRRRRRALLTQGDMGVLFQIASLPNNANVRVALAGAIRR